MARNIIPPENRFIKFVKETPTCWKWIGYIHPDGYGQFKVSTYVSSTAHRWLWEYTMGPIPKGKHLCHTCDTPACVRPAHLYIGTAQTNMDDKVKRGRQTKAGGRPLIVPKEEYTKVLELYTNGVSVRHIARQYGVHFMTVYRVLKRGCNE